MKQYNDLMSTTYWAEARDEVEKINKPLFDIIDLINPDKSCAILRIRYPYGALIYDKSRLCLPDNKGKFHTIDSSYINSSLRDSVNYSLYPITLQLKKGGECYIEEHGKLYTINVYKPGELYGLYGFTAKSAGIEMDATWSLSSGARSAFLLPQLSDSRRFEPLKKTI